MSKTVLITGCSTGLGNITARKFASEGWNVIATMRKPDPSLGADHPERMIVTELDVTNPASIEAALAAGIARFGQIDAVVNNAGVSIISVFEATPMDAIRRVFETNVFGTMNVIQAVTPYFRGQGGGTIVNITSNIGYSSFPLFSVYAASKHAVEGLSESLAYELETQNISLKLVEPGSMLSTSFGSNTLSSSQAASVPEPYKPYFDHIMECMMSFPLGNADENEVANQIYTAANEESVRLRYPSGPDAEETARLRWTTSEETYMAAMREMLGHTAWRDKQGK